MNRLFTDLYAIMVPTNRPGASLDYALQLAAQEKSFLLVLCSGQADATKIANRIAASGINGMAATLPHGYEYALLSGFRTDTFSDALYGAERRMILT